MTQEFERRFLSALEPAPEQKGDGIFCWKAFDRDTFEYYLRFIGDRGCKIHYTTSRRSDPREIPSFLSEFTSSQLDAVNDANPIGLFPNIALRDTTFDLGVLVHSSLINGSLTEKTDALGEHMYTVFPAYRCEFPLVEPSYQADLRLQRVIEWADWSRAPAPALRARFSLTSGIRSADGGEMHLLRFDELTPVMGDAVDVGGTIDVENFEGKRARLKYTGDECEIELENFRRTIAGSESPCWLQAFLVKGVIAVDM
ncbi:hypothetical protein [Burkholderia cepacia]|uniref:Uncharacterized protein n=1 Tax=Burkholderia cepacia TaxID=292 RepID=A0AAE8NBX5_BURCE|nr:hypothetical protein [Burkholderia cepacia]KVS73755.1 hypothetical protein WK41_11820 [Burkholderia cepacia]MCA8355201.1 hypothetical protein [Burkholderia cepacia]POM18458.1 hypothetical protein CSX04_06764 [Burkholderia cepacia]SPV16493.1 Uncharacterised protein [Burkholderia cepacia]